jgi:2-methylcitrate dehydratase PrpD
MSDVTMVKRLADWIVSFAAETIPPDVSVQAKHLLLDAIGCGLAAH